MIISQKSPSEKHERFLKQTACLNPLLLWVAGHATAIFCEEMRK